MPDSLTDDQMLHAVCRDAAYWPSVRPGSWTCTYETFAAHPRHPGWTYAYIGGKAEIWPNFYAMRTRLHIAPQEAISTHWPVESADHASHTGLVQLFRRAFGSNSDLLGTPSQEVRRLAQDNIAAWRAGGLTRESAVVPLKTGSAALAGAILLEWKQRSSLLNDPSRRLNGARRVPQIGLIMVHPAMQGYGVARSLLHHAVQKMQERGHAMIESAYRLVSDRARRWYQRQGFTEVPSRVSARLLAQGAERLGASATSSAEREKRQKEYEALKWLARRT